MSRRTVLRRGGMIATFGTTLSACADKVGAGIHRLTEPYLEPGEQPPDVTLMIQLLGRMVTGRFDNLLHLDRADIDERANDPVLRSRRDELANKLHEKLVALRQLLRLVFGVDLTRMLVPITGTTAVVPSEVHRQGEHTLGRLLDPEMANLANPVPGVDVDLVMWAGDLEPLVQELGETLGSLGEEKHRASTSVEQKNKTMRELDFHYSHVYAVLRGLLFLVGLNKDAQELPTLNRARRSLRGPNDNPTSSDEGSDEPSDGSGGDGPAGDEPGGGDSPGGDLPGEAPPGAAAGTDPEGDVIQDPA